MKICPRCKRNPIETPSGYCRKCHNERGKEYYWEHKNKILSLRRELYPTHKYKETRKKYHRKLRLECLTHYGGDPPKCACCGETHIEFLTIDHIDGGGAEHRKKIGGGTAFYIWLRKNNFPRGFQVLCMNCNWSKGKYGYCPHQQEILVKK